MQQYCQVGVEAASRHDQLAAGLSSGVEALEVNVRPEGEDVRAVGVWKLQQQLCDVEAWGFQVDDQESWRVGMDEIDGRRGGCGFVD